VALSYFPGLERLRLRDTICYDFSALGEARMDQHEIDKLKPNPMVDMKYVW